MKVFFGWRIPAFPVDGSDAQMFRSQITAGLDKVQGVYDSAWVSDHPIPWAQWQRPDTPNLEGWTALNYYAAIYEDLTFGNIVLCNSYRSPALLAKMASTLSFLTEGRFILAIGAGWKEDEYRSYGYEFPRPSVRISQLEEGVQIIKKMWTEDSVTFKGRYYQVEGAYCSPKPDPVPPIMIGGGGEKLTMRVAARHADWWNSPNLSLDGYKHKLEVLRDHCEAVGRPFEDIRLTWAGSIATAEKEEEALKIATNNPHISKEDRFDPSERAFVGTPEQVAEQIGAFVDLGVDYFIFRFLDFPSTAGLELFANQVMDSFR